MLKLRHCLFILSSLIIFSHKLSATTADYYLLNTNFSGSPLHIMSLQNNNHIRYGNNELILNQYQHSTINNTSTIQGQMITATGPFTMGSETNATDTPVPASFSGTKFAIPHQRGDHTYFLYSPNRNASIQVNIGSAAPVNMTLTANVVTIFAAGDINNVVGHIQSDVPILVSHKAFLSRGEDGDAYPVPPATNELWGVTSIFHNFAAMQDNTTITVESSNGNSSSFIIADASLFVADNLNESLFQGNGAAIHVTADKPVAVVSSADLDGFESTAYLGKTHLSTRYGIPLEAEYITVVCPEMGTQVSLHSRNNPVIKQNCSSIGNLVSKAYFHANQSSINPGSYLESNKPVYIIFESLATDDEQNVLGSDREQYYLLNSNFSTAPLEIMSLENNNHIQLGNTEVILNKYQITSITDTSTIIGQAINATHSFTMASEANATDIAVPVSFAGTDFVIPHQRGEHTYFLHSLSSDALVEITIGNEAPVTISIPAGTNSIFAAGSLNAVTAKIRSNSLILISHKALLTSGEDADAYPVPPASQELWGNTSIFNNFSALEDNTTITVESSNGDSSSFVINDSSRFIPNILSEIQFQGNGLGVHVKADKPIAVTSTADQDGFETTAYLSEKHLANRFGIAIDAEYIAVVCPEAGTTLTLHPAGGSPITQSCSGNGNLLYKSYFHSSTNPIPKGSFLESSKPVYVVMESLANNDEQNLLGARNVPANNILVIVADDLGMDILQSFDIEGMSEADKATLDRVPTPNIDSLLINNGVKFTRVMANPVCSPTRASIQTGRYGINTGVRWATFELNNQELPLDETTIPELLNQRGYNHAAIGKWHLSDSTNGGFDGPRAAGYDYHSGSFQNLVGFIDDNNRWQPPSYYLWEKRINGEKHTISNYAPIENVDDALNWLNTQDLNQPWFIWLAFNTPHSPFQVPPNSTNPGPHHAALSGVPGDSAGIDSEADIYRAMVEYMDEEIGRLLASIPADELQQTTIIFIGDNGTPGRVTTGAIAPNHAKFTVYQQGINVPMVVAGAGISDPGRTSRQLINSTDLYATIMELSGIDMQTSAPLVSSNSISFLPILQNRPTDKLRKYAFSETSQHGTNARDGVAIQDNRFKLIRFEITGNEELYDLQADVLEVSNLLPLNTGHSEFTLRQNKYNELVTELGNILP